MVPVHYLYCPALGAHFSQGKAGAARFGYSKQAATNAAMRKMGPSPEGETQGDKDSEQAPRPFSPRR